MGLRSTWFAAIFMLGLCAVPSLAHADAVVGKITQVTGKAQVNRGSTSLDAAPNLPVQLHDQLKTEKSGQLTLQLLDNSIVTLNESSVLTIDESVVAGGTTTKVGLLSGNLHSLVSAAARTTAPRFEVKTPNAIAGVRGTDFTCQYKAGQSRPGIPNCSEFTDCETTTGTVVVTNNPPRPGVAVTVGPGYMTTVACQDPPQNPTPGTLGALAVVPGGLGPAEIVGIGAVTAGAIGVGIWCLLECNGGGGTGSPSR